MFDYCRTCNFCFTDPSGLPDILYIVAFVLTGLGWLTLIVFPRQSWANFWFAGLWVPLLLGLLYTFVLFYYFFSPYRSNPFHFFTLDGLRCLLSKDGLLLAIFLDILLLSLICGAWMCRKAAQIRMPYIYLLPCLLLTFGVPGTGFAFFALFVATGGRWSQMARFEGQPPTNTEPVFARPGADAT